MSAHPAGPLHAGIQAPPETAGARPVDAGSLDELAPAVWPRNAARGEDGVLRIAGVDVRDLAQEYGTPLFVLDEADFRSRAAEFAAAFGAESVHYAAKAFLSTEVARWVDQEGLSLDVCSAGELAVALRAGFPAERIALHGNNKSVDELAMAVEAGVGRVVLDSFHEIARLDAVARERGVVAPVMIRLTVGVEAHTHEFIATAHEDQKFGFSISGGDESDAAEAARRVLASKGLRLVGLHSHIGSQIFDTEGFEVAAHRVVRFLGLLHKEHSADALSSLTTLDLGGGFGIAYRSDETPLDVPELAEELRGIVKRECHAAGLDVPQIAVEPGRAIAGPGTVTLYEVGTLKDVPLGGSIGRRYVSVDGGMSDNIRTALYEAVYDCRLVSRSSERDGTAEAALSRVVGKHCESGDIVVRDCWLPADLAPGDLLGVAATGAYCYSMASSYNRLPRPAVVAVRDGVARVLLRRETVEDQFRLEVDPVRPPTRGPLPAARPGMIPGVAVKDPIRVALLGCGTVGREVVRLLRDQADELAARAGAPVELVGIAVRRPHKHDDLGDLLTTDASALITRPDVDVVVEVIGGIEPARTLLLEALKAGKSVVTANKALLAEDGASLAEAADASGVDLYYEASVAGAIPLLRPLRESLAGDRITRVAGIVNGTTNFILSAMTESGSSYADALEEATRLGYAEADPSADVDGYDAASKAAILATLAFHTRVTAADVHCEGIRSVTASDIAAATGMGCVIKLLAICERTPARDGSPESVSARVYPAMIPATHPLAAVDGAFNAVFVEAEAAGQLMFYGQGAGGAPTASAVLGDLVAVARNRVVGGRGPRESAYASLPVRPMGMVPTRYHVSLEVADRAGVLATIAGEFAHHGVSIAAVRQTGGGDDGEAARLVVVTHAAPEAALAATVQVLTGLDAVVGVDSVLRVEDLGRKGVAG